MEDYLKDRLQKVLDAPELNIEELISVFAVLAREFMDKIDKNPEKTKEDLSWLYTLLSRRRGVFAEKENEPSKQGEMLVDLAKLFGGFLGQVVRRNLPCPEREKVATLLREVEASSKLDV